MLKNIVTFNNARLRIGEDGQTYLDLEIFIDDNPHKVIVMYSILAGKGAMDRMDENTRRMLGQLNYDPATVL